MNTRVRLGGSFTAVAVAAVLGACGGGADPELPARSGQPAAQALALPPSQAALARWSDPLALTLVPAAAALLPDGKVLLWAGEDRLNAGLTGSGLTYTSLYDPAGNGGNGSAAERLVTETGHDMFCPGTTNLPDGRILVNGGSDSGKTSVYDATHSTWTAAAVMVIPRGYQSNTLLRDGSVFTIGGSWSGGVGNKHAEVWTPSGGWRRLTGVPIDSMLGSDPNFVYGNDSHPWLLPAANGRVLYAGPGVNMQWISTTGDGSVAAAGRRGDDVFSINGNAVMYDAGKILKAGGSTSYNERDANANSYVIDVTSGAAVVRKVASMAYRRTFHNSVVLPNGQVVVIGGQTYGRGYTDENAVMAPELFDPATESWTVLPQMHVPRNYHSIALLLPDARVLAGGGGLCGTGCPGNHADVEVLSPHYLFQADGAPAVRPVILSAPASVGYGTGVAVTTDVAVSAFSMVRVGSVTHSINNDQRRLPLTYTTQSPGAYTLQVPSNPGLLLPGYWMLFAIDAQGTPSVAAMVRVDAGAAPRLTPLPDQSGITGVSATVSPAASDPGNAALQFSATGLPPGLSIAAATGHISGTPTQAGRFLVALKASNGGQATSTEFVWNLSAPAASWTVCAYEGQTCSFSGTRTVRYGKNGVYATRTATGSIACTNAVFGDPLPGVPKQCEFQDTTAPPPVGTAAAPAFSLAAGSYVGTQSVSLSTTTAGASIHYTTNGSTPTTASTPYTAPLSIAATTTVKALAAAAGLTPSAVVSATYTITTAASTGWTRCAGEGQTCTFTGTRTVRYGANGVYATRSATGSIACTNAVFGDPLPGVAKQCDVQDSTSPPPVGTAAAPSFSPAPGSYTAAQTVSLATTTSGATIHYTTNGATPTTASPPYTAPLSVTATTVVKALAAAPGLTSSTVVSGTYTIGVATGWTRCAGEGQTCSFSGTRTVRYGANGVYATRTATGSIACTNAVFGDPLPGVSKQCDVQDTTSPPPVGTAATPSFSPAPGSYTAAQTVSLATTTSGAAIHYTTNGATPTAASPQYTGPLSVSATTTLKALAVAAGLADSAVASATYTIGSPSLWTRCAGEGQTCSFSGTRSVRYGANGVYATRTATGSIACTNAVFGDPLPGVPKQCEYQ